MRIAAETGAGPGRVVRLPGAGLSLRVEPRSAAVAVALGAALAALVVLAVSTGEISIPPGDVVSALLGGGDRSTWFVVETLRLPRALTGALVGAALGAPAGRSSRASRATRSAARHRGLRPRRVGGGAGDAGARGGARGAMSASERPFPLHAGIATVVAVRAVTPATSRVTLHAPAFAEPGIEQPGEILTLGWSPDGSPLVLPGAGWRFPSGRPAQHWRNFTVRRFDPDRATIDVEFFLHGDAGIASAWARRARPGDRVGFAGPRVDWQPDPTAACSLLVADETGLPAMLAILESLPAGHRAVAVAEVSGRAERRPVRCGADAEIHWLERGDPCAPTTTPLVDALRALALPRARGQVWGGGEALAMRDVRRHVAAGHPELARSMRVRGYWRAAPYRATPGSERAKTGSPSGPTR